MSVECSICENDARQGHADDCPRATASPADAGSPGGGAALPSGCGTARARADLAARFPGHAGNPSAGAETCTCPFLTRGVHARGCPAVPSPEDTVEPDACVPPLGPERHLLARVLGGSVTPPAVRTGEDDGAVPGEIAELLLTTSLRSKNPPNSGAMALEQAAALRPLIDRLSARPLVSGTAAAYERAAALVESVPTMGSDGLLLAKIAARIRALPTELVSGTENRDDEALRKLAAEIREAARLTVSLLDSALTQRLLRRSDELLALLGGDQNDEVITVAAGGCPVTSHGAVGGWHCAVEGPHHEHRNAAGTQSW